jgi:hypothetical protein
MRFHAVDNHLGYPQCLTCFPAAYSWLAPRNDAVEKLCNLVGETVFFGNLDRIEPDGREAFRLGIAADGVAVHAVIGEIADDVAVGLEYADAPLALIADAAGGHGRYTSAPEHDARVCQVGHRIDHRGADGVHCGYGQAHETLNDIDVVDHEIENDVHLARAVLPWRDAIALDVKRTTDLIGE